MKKIILLTTIATAILTFVIPGFAFVAVSTNVMLIGVNILLSCNIHKPKIDKHVLLPALMVSLGGLFLTLLCIIKYNIAFSGEVKIIMQIATLLVPIGIYIYNREIIKKVMT